jgi:metal-sulfur cluster biosynthetic enzyme
MLQAEHRDRLQKEIERALETIVDPCSRAMGAPGGLISLGLVRSIEVEKGDAKGSRVRVTLCLTEPGCLMGALFQETAQRLVTELPGVTEADVRIDHGHVWEPGQLEAGYRRRLDHIRTSRLEHMRALRLSAAEPIG